MAEEKCKGWNHSHDTIAVQKKKHGRLASVLTKLGRVSKKERGFAAKWSGRVPYEKAFLSVFSRQEKL